jgi:hypothetical protein
MLSEGNMTYNYRTKRALKFWFWLCAGLNALAVCTAIFAVSGDKKTLILGALAAVWQVIHGVRVAFYNKTLVNMLTGFMKFQMLLLFICTSCVAAEIGGAYGWAVFALAAAEYIVSLVIPKRRAIKEGIKELLLI